MSYEPDHHGTGQMLSSPAMAAVVAQVAEKIRVRAELIAPRDRGTYKASFGIRVSRRGGATRDRAEAVLYNDAPDAIFVEYGSAGEEPYHVMLRAATEGFRL